MLKSPPERKGDIGVVRKFLYAFAVLIVVFFLGRVALSFWSGNLAKMALVPGHGFENPPPLAGNAWDDPEMWFSRPGMADDPARYRPVGLSAEEAPVGAAVFFIHPTSYLDRAHWNAPLEDRGAGQLATKLIGGMASAFNASPSIWAPRYRQATFGAFLADRPERTQAVDLAYADVHSAFEVFLANIPASQPIVLVGHSQGALHLKRLMRDEVAGKRLAKRIAAAYVIGWPVSLDHDLPAMGLPACTAAGQPGCVLGWQSYGEPADPRPTLEAYGSFPSLDGKGPAGSRFLCTNPLTGAPDSAAPASANLGTLVPDATGDSGILMRGLVPARCGPDGFLLVGSPPAMGAYVLPGNNYHVYDVMLFWANVRADMAARVAAWQAAR